MRRVLIVSPHFPPINAPDHQRVRMALPWFRRFGWEPVVLCVRTQDVEGFRDPNLARTIPRSVRVIRTKAVSPRLTRPFGFGSLALRALPTLRRAGDQLLAQEHFDLVFFSTTMFTTMTLGSRWKRKYGVPYVLDFQDPWLSTFYDRPNAPPPPGGALRYGVAKYLARRNEPGAVRQADHIISVSPTYPEVLKERYSDVPGSRFTVLPFGGPEHDFRFVEKAGVRQTIFNPDDGLRHWVYVGRGGGDMQPVLRVFFKELARSVDREPLLRDRLMLHFVGTSYAIGGRATQTVMPVATACGVESMVREHTSRIPYHESLRVMMDSDLVMLIGSTDASYTASKLYPCMLTRRPILGLFHQNSSVVSIMEECKAGRVVAFGNDGPEHCGGEFRSAIEWALKAPREYSEFTRRSAVRRYTAQSMTKTLCGVFDRIAGSE